MDEADTRRSQVASSTDETLVAAAFRQSGTRVVRGYRDLGLLPEHALRRSAELGVAFPE